MSYEVTNELKEWYVTLLDLYIAYEKGYISDEIYRKFKAQALENKDWQKLCYARCEKRIDENKFFKMNVDSLVALSRLLEAGAIGDEEYKNQLKKIFVR